MQMQNKRIYQFGKSRLILEFGDLAQSNAQVLVSSVDSYLTMGDGVARALLRTGGNAIALDAAKKVPAKVSEVVVTTAGNLPAQYIFHGITLGTRDQNLSDQDIVRKITSRCLQLIEILQLNSIAFPALGTGVAGFNLEEVAVEMAQAIAQALSKQKRSVEVSIVLYDKFDDNAPTHYLRFFEEFASLAPRIENRKVSSDSSQTEEEVVLKPEIVRSSDEIKYQRINHIRKLLASLEDQRNRIEESLIDALNDSQKEPEIKTLREKLSENEELRFSYVNELKVLSEKDVTTLKGHRSDRKHKIVFVSSTYKDLVDHRAIVKDQIVRRDMLFRGMEHSGASPLNSPPAVKVIDEVKNADVYLGVFGVRYGSIDYATGLSITELEFNEAEANRKPLLLYLIHEDAPVKVADIESDAECKVKLDRLKNRIQKNYTVYKFSSKEDLARQVFEDLGKL